MKSFLDPGQSPRVVALDGDDTLWHNETLFSASHDEFRDLLTRHVAIDGPRIDERLLETEKKNLALYGFGIKGFVLSMIETAIEMTEGRIPAEDIEAIMRFGRRMLAHPVELIDGVEETIRTLRSRDHQLWLITKGDLFDQESKIARSGLAPLFDRIEIVSEKDEATYRKLLDRHGVDAQEFAMAGNSLRSDVLPVARLGARAYHIPYQITWAYEQAADAGDTAYATLETIRALPGALGTP
jgi:putative hydrolase of the HAD superfamily